MSSSSACRRQRVPLSIIFVRVIKKRVRAWRVSPVVESHQHAVSFYPFDQSKTLCHDALRTFTNYNYSSTSRRRACGCLSAAWVWWGSVVRKTSRPRVPSRQAHPVFPYGRRQSPLPSMRYDPPLLTCFRPKAFHTTASTHSNSTSQRGDLGARATLLSPLFFLARDYTIIM